MNLSIVIPTTGRDTLDRAVISAKAVADEVVVIHDDGTYGAPGLARNGAMDLVTGDWVGFCDDDDELADTYRATVEEAAGIGADAVVMSMTDPELGQIPLDLIVAGTRLWHGNFGISFALRTDLWRANPFIAGPPITARIEDYELIRRLMDQGHKVAVSPTVTYLVGGQP